MSEYLKDNLILGDWLENFFGWITLMGSGLLPLSPYFNLGAVLLLLRPTFVAPSAAHEGIFVSQKNVK